GNGIHIEPLSDSVAASNYLIQGNFIGTNAAGTAALGNGANGILIENPHTVNALSFGTIGGTITGAGNLISGNQGSGVKIMGIGGARNLLQGNKIGAEADGQTSLGNSGNGVWFSTAAQVNTVGGTSAGAGNVIAFNGLSGVFSDGIQSLNFR